MKNIIVIGAGSSGLVAAIMAAREGARVTVLEAMNKPGKKLLLTGSGKCNLTTLDPNLEQVYQSSETTEKTQAFVKKVLHVFSVSDTLDFYHEIGLMTRARGLYVYPATEQSSSVLAVLMAEAERLGVRFKYNTKVLGLSYQAADQNWHVAVAGWEYAADAVILCCGSKAAPATGSDGSGYVIAKELKLKQIPATPALTAVLSEDPDIALSAGARTHAKVSLLIEGSMTSEQIGEVQWIKEGISGIAVFQLSGRVGQALRKKKNVILQIDFLPELSEYELFDYLNAQIVRNPSNVRLSLLLQGVLQERILKMISKKMERLHAAKKDMLVPDQKKGSDHKTSMSYDRSVQMLISQIKEFNVQASGLRDYVQAQTCCGGISIEEIDPAAMELKRMPGLYIAGELMDIDGPCGGYNLQWAFSTGACAGRNAARKIIQ